MSINQGKKKSIWLSIVLFLILVLVGAYAYQEWRHSPRQQVNQPEIIELQNSILEQNDAINTNWLRTLNPLVENVEGRIVWSNTLQKGVMEFFDLPRIADDHKYQLWIYDLTEKNSKPILSKEFTDVSANLMLVPFSPKELILSPFKFELMLKTEDQTPSQPLFLAQP